MPLYAGVSIPNVLDPSKQVKGYWNTSKFQARTGFPVIMYVLYLKYENWLFDYLKRQKPSTFAIPQPQVQITIDDSRVDSQVRILQNYEFSCD